MNLTRVVLFWAITYALLTLLFAQSYDTYAEAFYFVSLLLPVIISTSYFYNSYLIPRFLLAGRYRRFALYALYTLLVSIYLETWVVILALVLIANYQYAELSPVAADVFQLAVTLYAIVLINAVTHLFLQLKKGDKEQAEPLPIQEKATLTLISERKKVVLRQSDILYIESLGDRIQCHVKGRTPVVSKSRISHLETELPDDFVRVHRSFLVNRQHVLAHNKESVTLENAKLPISRKYKESAMEALLF